MSVAVGVVTDTAIHLAADSAAGEENLVLSTTEPKLWPVGRSVVAMVGSWRDIQIAQEVSVRPRRSVDSYVQALRFRLAEAGRLGEGSEMRDDAELLIATPSGLWVVDSAFGVFGCADFAAIGIGAPFAWGALGAGASAAGAVEVAIRYCPYVCGPTLTASVTLR